jgi:DNA-binding MarR family transcriptional regulator
MKNHTKHFQLVDALGDKHIGLEARAQIEDHLDMKIWLRLLACSTQIEQQIRRQLRARFGTTLPRFDYLAQLARHPQGLRMNLLSRYLMVTGGNVTGLTDQLVKEALVERTLDADDRRSYLVVLTEKGRSEFAAMAVEHEQWLTDMFGGLPQASKDALYEHLGHLRVHLAHGQSATEPLAQQPNPSSSVDPALLAGNRKRLAGYEAGHFVWQVESGVATLTLNRPERKNPLTFDSYAELRDLFHQLKWAEDVHAVVIVGAGDNFCSGGDVHEIIGPLDPTQSPRIADVHPHDGRAGQDHARLSAAHRRRCGWRVCRRRRHHGHGQRYAARHCAQQDRLSFQPRRLGRLRHGRLRHAAAHRRPGRASDLLYTGRSWAARRASAGAGSTACASPLPCWPKHRHWPRRLPKAPRLPTASPRPCCTRNGP